MKTAVTGGLGFIGSNLVRMLVARGDDVVVFDDRSTGDVARLDPAAAFVEGTVVDADALRGVIEGCDAVFHLAARNIIASMAHPLDDLEVNIRGTFNVFSVCQSLKIPRVVYASTSSIYGNSRTLPVQEDALPLFLNFYSVSKFAGEAYAQTFAHAHGLHVNVVRYSNVYGPNQSASNPYCGVVGKFIDQALRGEDVIVYGDGEQTRDFTFVDDACTATIEAVDAPILGEAFNVASGVETSVNDLARLIIEITNSDSDIRYATNRDIDNIRRRVLSIDKAALALRYSPQVSLRDGLRRTIDWYNAESESSETD